MLFTQIDFIFVFLPITLIGYVLIGRYARFPLLSVAFLAIASLVFYAQWKVSFLPVILVSIVVNYAFGAALSAQSGERERRLTLAAAVAANLLALGFYKYTNFAIATLNDLTALDIKPRNIKLPLGISFFTFTQIAFLVDVYAGKARERNFVKYTLFVTYFPHLIAGPILHHSEMMPQFGDKEARAFRLERFSIALTIFAIGLFKKAIIADGFALIANPIFTSASTGGVTMLDGWAGALAYSLQIYFDFSGYCDMAIGLSLMFGIRLPYNFDSPYKALSISEFWRRWHITLSRFLRDYLYIPLGGNRRGPGRRTVNLMTTMLLGGLWHGAGWTFVIWGGLHGAYLVVNHSWSGLVHRTQGLKAWAATAPYRTGALLVTQIAVVVAWVFFRADRFTTARRIVSAMAGAKPKASLGDLHSTTLPSQLALIAAGYLICLALPNVNSMFACWQVGLETYHNPRPWVGFAFDWRLKPAWAVVAALMLVAGIVVSLVVGEASPFLYFQF